MDADRIATIDALMAKMASLWPHSFPNERLMTSWTGQYRTVLSGLSGDELNAAWHHRNSDWSKKSAPSPADILASHNAISTKPRSASNGKMSVTEQLAENDRIRCEERRKLIDDYTAGHASGFEMARVEGWHFQLETQVKRAAHMISQRNEMRRAKKIVPAWRAEFCDSTDEYRQANFIPWFSIVTDDAGEDRIEIDQQTLRVWRAQAQIEGPPLRSPPSKSSTFKRAAA